MADPPREIFIPIPQAAAKPTTMETIKIKLYCKNWSTCAHLCPTCDEEDRYSTHFEYFTQKQYFDKEICDTLASAEDAELFGNDLENDGFSAGVVPWESVLAHEIRECLYSEGDFEKRYSCFCPPLCESVPEADIDHYFVVGRDETEIERLEEEAMVPPTAEEIFAAGMAGNFTGPVGSAEHAAGLTWGTRGFDFRRRPPSTFVPIGSGRSGVPNVVGRPSGSNGPIYGRDTIHIDMTRNREGRPHDEEPPSLIDIVEIPEPTGINPLLPVSPNSNKAIKVDKGKGKAVDVPASEGDSDRERKRMRIT
ncbi:MAG: hypothetical protein M1812_004531 [Candelaria pacifica]|nr:MAG: hypothetical protein M1812_004531 [Candelaria pacifica]